MAYTQKPGRGNNPKTGHGIPSPLMQTDIELTNKYTRGRQTLATRRQEGNTPSGLNVDSKTGFASAKGYEKKIVTQPSGDTLIVDSSGKTIESAKANKFNSTAVDALKKKYEKEKTSTGKYRHNNSEFYNANSGGTSPDILSESQKKSLVGLGKATRTNK
jgi:hypothetical protein